MNNSHYTDCKIHRADYDYLLNDGGQCPCPMCNAPDEPEFFVHVNCPHESFENFETKNALETHLETLFEKDPEDPLAFACENCKISDCWAHPDYVCDCGSCENCMDKKAELDLAAQDYRDDCTRWKDAQMERNAETRNNGGPWSNISLKEQKRRIYGLLLSSVPVSKKSIAKKLQWGLASVSFVLRLLMKDGVVTWRKTKRKLNGSTRSRLYYVLRAGPVVGPSPSVYTDIGFAETRADGGKSLKKSLEERKRRLYRFLCKNPPTTKNAIAWAIKWAPSTVAWALNGLMQDGLVGSRKSRRGRHPSVKVYFVPDSRKNEISDGRLRIANDGGVFETGKRRDLSNPIEPLNLQTLDEIIEYQCMGGYLEDILRKGHSITAITVRKQSGATALRYSAAFDCSRVINAKTGCPHNVKCICWGCPSGKFSVINGQRLWSEEGKKACKNCKLLRAPCCQRPPKNAQEVSRAEVAKHPDQITLSDENDNETNGDEEPDVDETDWPIDD